jgi:hypothetical protein
MAQPNQDLPPEPVGEIHIQIYQIDPHTRAAMIYVRGITEEELFEQMRLFQEAREQGNGFAIHTMPPYSPN